MIIDFHTHGKLAKRVDFDLEFFKEVIANAKESGLTALALTEHFNTKNFYEIYETLDEHFEYKHDYYDVNGFKVFTGMEVDAKEIGHLLFLANKESILEIRNQLSDHTTEETFLPITELLNLADKYGVLKIGAHPLRESTPLHQHPEEVLRRFDAFDLNGKDMHVHGVEAMKFAVHEFADMCDVPVVCGSDSHHPIHIGVVKNKLPECETVEDIKQAIRTRSFTSEISPVLHTRIQAATIVKKKMKEELVYDNVK